jgi:bisphosphoglycerate-dependent phosphoglycerate mutase
MAVDNLSQEEVLNLEPATGIPILYDINEQGKVISKTTLD